MTAPAGDRPPLRIGTKEREAAYAALSAHLDAGRLDVDEYADRYARASLARTRPELEELFIDLPTPHPAFDPVPTAQPQPSWATAKPADRGFGQRARFAARIAVLIPVLAIVLAVTTGFWFVFFIVPAAFALFGRGRRHAYNGHCRTRGNWAPNR